VTAISTGSYFDTGHSNLAVRIPILVSFVEQDNEKFIYDGWVLIEITQSFSSCDEEKMTKGLVHCEERPAPLA
jgi:hypothetical protein